MTTASAPESWEEYARAGALKLQRHRIAGGLNQEKLAHMAGITRTHYQQIERGRWKKDQPANPSLKLMVSLAQTLKVEDGDLLPSVTRMDQAEEIIETDSDAQADCEFGYARKIFKNNQDGSEIIEC